jgi:hypothetical protein
MWLTKNRIVVIALFLTGLVIGGWAVFNANRAKAEEASPVISQKISESTLESQYGMRVNLLAVTGAGGFVDVRIKIVDGEKARVLLTDKKNFPALLSKSNVILIAPEDTKSQEIRYDDGGTMFIMYPNSGNVVQRGAPVNILFGDLAVEAIDAQ